MVIENIITFSAGFLTLIVPLYLLYINSKSAVNRIYAFTSIITGPLWATTIVFFREADTIEQANFWVKGIYISAVLIGFCFHSFARIFPRQHKTSRVFDLIVYFLGALIFLDILFTGNFVTAIQLNNEGNNVELGFPYYIWLIWMMSIFIYGAIEILRDYSKLGPIEKHQLRFFTFGIIIPTFGVIPTNAILPIFGIYKYIWMGPLFMIAMNLIIAYGVTRVRFISSRYAIIQAVRIALLCLYFFAWFSFVYAIVLQIQAGSKTASILFIIACMILLTILLFPYKELVDKVLVKLIVRGRYDSMRLMELFSKSSANQLNIDKLSIIILNTISQAFGIDRVGLVIMKQNFSEIIYSQYKNISQISFEDLLKLITYGDEYLKKTEPLILSELEYKMVNEGHNLNAKEAERLGILVRLMNNYSIGMVFAILPQADYQGLLLVGVRKNKEVFTLEDINFVKSLISLISVSIGRAFLYSEVENFNQELQEKIAQATTQISGQKKELEKALQKERDMLDILGHELRTPLSIARNSAQMITKEFTRKMPGEEKVHKYLDIINENLERETNIVENILTGTKIDNKGLNLYLTSVDALDVIHDSLLGFKSKAEKKGLELVYVPPENQVNIWADRTRIQEVIDNLIDNAVKYTEKGMVTITLTAGQDYAAFIIQDSGRGIPADEIPKLGQKFYRVNTYLENGGSDLTLVRPGGTGLGLYVVFGLVKAMQGKIEVHSEIGKGTTFTVRIPSYKGQVVPEQSARKKFHNKIDEYKNRKNLPG